jgi:hypothetical protein
MAPVRTARASGPVSPHRAVRTDQVAADQIGCGQVVVATHGDQRPPETGGHVLDETRLAASGGALDQQRQALAEGVPEQGDLLRLFRIERRCAEPPRFTLIHHARLACRTPGSRVPSFAGAASSDSTGSPPMKKLEK